MADRHPNMPFAYSYKPEKLASQQEAIPQPATAIKSGVMHSDNDSDNGIVACLLHTPCNIWFLRASNRRAMLDDSQ
jgi:hypothetical protein